MYCFYDTEISRKVSSTDLVQYECVMILKGMCFKLPTLKKADF